MGQYNFNNDKHKYLKNNTQLTTFYLTSFSNTNVTFLSEQVANKKLFQIGYYHFFKIPQLELGILKDFLQILDYNKAYIVLPLLATAETTGAGPILSLSKQILVTRDSNPITISNFLFNQIELACMNYGIDNLGDYTVVLKFRPIALKPEITQAIPQIQYEIQEKHIKKNITMMNYKVYNGTIIPLSMNLDLYGERLSTLFSAYYILKFDLDPNGMLFYKDEYVIYILDEGTRHEGILFKDKDIYYKFEDVLIEGSSFIRTTDKYILHIDNFNISYFDKLTINSFISPSRANAKLNTKIVTFDIETFVKDGQFVPFACG
jgi:hypothetical protein